MGLVVKIERPSRVFWSNVTQAAQILQTSRQTVYALILTGALPAYKSPMWMIPTKVLLDRVNPKE